MDNVQLWKWKLWKLKEFVKIQESYAVFFKLLNHVTTLEAFPDKLRALKAYEPRCVITLECVRVAILSLPQKEESPFITKRRR
jgi:hypothetical protein